MYYWSVKYEDRLTAGVDPVVLDDKNDFSVSPTYVHMYEEASSCKAQLYLEHVENISNSESGDMD